MATHDSNPALQSLRELPAPAKNATEMSQSGISQPTSGNGEHDLVIEIPEAVESIPRHSAHPNEPRLSPQSLNHDVYELAENVGIIDVSIDSRMKDRLTDLDASPLEVHAALRKPLASKTARFVFWAGHESSIFRLLLDLFPLNSKSGSMPHERRVAVVGEVTSVAALRAIYQGTEDDVYIIQCVGGRWRYSFHVIMFVLPHDSLLYGLFEP